MDHKHNTCVGHREKTCEICAKYDIQWPYTERAAEEDPDIYLKLTSGSAERERERERDREREKERKREPKKNVTDPHFSILHLRTSPFSVSTPIQRWQPG